MMMLGVTSLLGVIVDDSRVSLRITGHNIDPLARRLAIVDAYVTMMESRPYQAVRTKTEVRAEIVRCAGSQFSLALAADFVKYAEQQL